MKTVLSDAGRAFIRSFGAALVILIPGILAAPNQKTAIALSVAALIGSLVFGLKSLQTFVPALSWASIVKQPWAARLDSFTRAFLSSLLVGLTGWLAMPDLSTWKSVIFGILVGAVSAGFRTVEAWLTPGESPSPESGIRTPAPKVAPTG